MLEALAAKSAYDGKCPDKMTKAELRDYNIFMGVLSLLWLIFWVWALMRARKCASSSSDSKAIHYLFATASPFMYVILSYATFGCK